MSKIGKKPIALPNEITAEVSGALVRVQGKKGTLEIPVLADCAVEVKDGESGKEIRVAVTKENRQSRANWGTLAALIRNAVQGAHAGFEKKLELQGIGYRASLEGKGLNLALGFSHPVKYQAPEGIGFTVEKNIITISGINKETVGQVAAEIRALKKPEPYQGKGIRYVGEVVRRKAGKKAAAAGAKA